MPRRVSKRRTKSRRSNKVSRRRNTRKSNVSKRRNTRRRNVSKRRNTRRRNVSKRRNTREQRGGMVPELLRDGVGKHPDVPDKLPAVKSHDGIAWFKVKNDGGQSLHALGSIRPQNLEEGMIVKVGPDEPLVEYVGVKKNANPLAAKEYIVLDSERNQKILRLPDRGDPPWETTTAYQWAFSRRGKGREDLMQAWENAIEARKKETN